MSRRVTDTIAANGLCIGCGACAAACPRDRLYTDWDDSGCYIVRSREDSCDSNCGLCLKVCPFADGNPDEDTLSAELFTGTSHQDLLGRFRSCWVGHSNRGDQRPNGASGGVATWFLTELLRQDKVDRVVCVARHPGPRPLFTYTICQTPEQVEDCSRSAYYPVEMSAVIEEVLRTDARYAFVCLPCFAKALRLMMRSMPRLRERIICIAGLVCGQSASAFFADYCAALAGPALGPPSGVTFRTKDPRFPATELGTECAWETSQGTVVKQVMWSQGVGEAWGLGWFTPNPCLYCDDVFAETADVTFMDAWLPEYEQDYRGTSLIVVRSEAAAEIVRSGVQAGTLDAKPAAPGSVIASQQSVVTHKRDALAHRLWVAQQGNTTVPSKRVGAKPAQNQESGARWEARIKASRHGRSLWAEVRSAPEFRRRMATITGWPPARDQAPQTETPVFRAVRSFETAAARARARTRKAPAFLLAGNGPYSNRGCEAIVRGSVELLSERFSGASYILSSFGLSRFDDACGEKDSRIIHNPHRDCLSLRKYSPEWWMWRCAYGRSKEYLLRRRFGAQLRSALRSDAALMLGGDNYTLDYEVPTVYVELNRALLSTGIPVVLWGASVGPFTTHPEFEDLMREHLRQITLIMARESETVAYLRSIGVEDNVRAVADPAFVMTPSEPSLPDDLAEFVERRPLGLNLSALAGNYGSARGTRWTDTARSCVQALLDSGLGPVLLVPHVTIDAADGNDHAFLVSATEGIQDDRLRILPPVLNAQEYKWAISKTRAFAGTRMHSTVAALSTCVPTLSLGYSMKSRGINKDVFGHTEWLLPVEQIGPDVLLSKFRALIERQEEVRCQLAQVIPGVQERARAAADYLAPLVGR